MIVAPPIEQGGWRGAIIDRHDLGGEMLISVTVRRRFGQVARRWFPDHRSALVHALEQADQHSLPLIDLSAGDEPEAG